MSLKRLLEGAGVSQPGEEFCKFGCYKIAELQKRYGCYPGDCVANALLEHSNIIPGTYIAACHHPIFTSIRVIPDHEFVR